MKQPLHRHISFGLTIAVLFSGTLVSMLIGWVFRATSYDYMQHDSDAAYFFDAASAGHFDFKLDASVIEEENWLPLTLWSGIYGTISQLGVSPGPFWGILLNAFLVFISHVITVSFARRTFGLTNLQSLGLALLLALNGVMMLFAGIHMRDAFLLITTTASIVLLRPGGGSTPGNHVWQLAALIALMYIAFLCRTEGFTVPLMIYILALGVKLRRCGRIQKVLFAGAALGGAVAAVASGFLDLAVHNYSAYQLLAQTESKESSLAYYLLYELPFPISTGASTVLLLFIKIPFWRGMFFDSYSFFMSIAAVQMLFIAPAIIVIIFRSLFHEVGSDVYYLVLVQLGLLLMVAVTSNQVRHFAIGYPFLILLYHLRRQIVGTRGPYIWAQRLILSIAVLLSVAVEFR